jgi:hypothetical protein
MIKSFNESSINNNVWSRSLSTNNFRVFPVVSGGTLTSDATYYYRRFTSNGTLSVTQSQLVADVFIVGGGGGGGQTDNNSGVYCGGGGGGYTKTFLRQSLLGNTSVVIGAGGAAASTSGGDGFTGQNSSFGNLFANGGGPGYGTTGTPTGAYYDGGNGGSGGGSYGAGYSDGNGKINETGMPVFSEGRGTGDGAGQGSTTREFGEFGKTLYAGGGGGGTWIAPGAPGGAGGGGSGSGANWNAGGNTFPMNGTVNTGGGGGGRTTAFNGPGAGSGGSGIVIVRYLRSEVGE